jgi:hypothetical protein
LILFFIIILKKIIAENSDSFLYSRISIYVFVFFFLIRNSLQEANDILNEVSDSLENGVYEKTINEEEFKVRFSIVLLKILTILS